MTKKDSNIHRFLMLEPFCSYLSSMQRYDYFPSVAKKRSEISLSISQQFFYTWRQSGKFLGTLYNIAVAVNEESAWKLAYIV